MIRKKLLKNVSKKFLAVLLSMAMLFSNFMPLATVFALDDNEKADLVQINVRNSESIQINGNTATIEYERGIVTVSGNNLSTEEISWDYGEYMGTMNVLYTTSANLTFDADPNPGNKVFCYFDGQIWENNDENFEFNGLETFSVKHQSGGPGEYEIEFDFMDVNEPDPQPPLVPREATGATYSINFGGNSWEIDGRTVSASIEGKDLTSDVVTVSDTDVIKMNGFDGGMMEIRLNGQNGFSIGLFTNGENETALTFINGDGVLPGEGVLTFEVVRHENHNPHSYHIDFGTAQWFFDDGETIVTASVEGKDLTKGFVDLAEDDVITLTNYDPSRMQVRVMVEDGFTFLMNVDEEGKLTPLSTPQDAQLPDDLDISFWVENLGDEPDPNPPQEGEHTATVCVSGVEGSFIWRYYDDERGEDVEVEIPYDGPGGSAATEGTRFSINYGAIYQFRTNGDVFENFQGEDRYICTAIEYNYDDLDGEDPDYIKLWLGTPFEAMFSNDVVVNNVHYTVSDYLDYTDRSDWLHGIVDENVGFELTIPKTQDDVYNVTVQVDPSEYYYLGRFEWTNGEYDREWPSYIANSTLEVESVSFELDGETTTYTADRFNEDFDDYLIHYEVDPNNHVDRGMLMAPDNAIITFRIIPKYGYQVTNIEVEGGYTTFEDGEYIFTIPRSEEDFQVEVSAVNDTISVNHDYFLNGNVDFRTNIFPGGTANIEITEPNLTNGEITAFETYAADANIETIFNVVVQEVLYKGSSGATWTEEIDGFNRYSEVTVQLKDLLLGDEVRILHQVGDNEFETLSENLYTYDKSTKTITFRTMSFGNFAIATTSLTPIEGINITLEAPMPGVTVEVTQEIDPETNEPYPVGNPAPVVTVNGGEPYYVDSTAWVRGTCRDGSGACNEYFNGTFDINGDYYALISVSAKEGNKFTYDTLDHITINGRALDTKNGDEIFNIYDDGRNTVFIAKINSGTNEEPQVLRGDLNGNGKIDLADIIALLKKYLNNDSTPQDMAVCDMDQDGNIGLRDIIMLLKEYLNG